MATQLLRGYWFLDRHNHLFLIEAAGRLSANEAYQAQHGHDRVLLSVPAVICSVCGYYKPAIAGLINGAIHVNYAPCELTAPGHPAPPQPT